MSRRKKIIIGFFVVLFPLGLYGGFHYFNLGVGIFQPKAAESLPQNIATFVDYWEHRVDSNGDGVFDSYWGYGSFPSGCSIALFALDSGALKWNTPISVCTAPGYVPTFYNRSFMGDNSSDFTLIVAGAVTASNPQGLYLYAGDGGTGVVRNFPFPIGDAYRPGVIRVRGISVVDFKLSKYPGPALFVRTTGGSSNQHGHLLYFPANSSSGIDISTDPAIISYGLVQQYPFPGIDIAELDGTYGDRYTAIYNQFNYDLRLCAPIVEQGGRCGFLDGGNPTDPTWNSGTGLFMGAAAQGDIDADGVEDILTVYTWRSVVYPGRPKGSVNYLGVPQWDVYFNPQNDGQLGHIGRQYGVTKLTQVDNDPYLETVQIGGLPVDYFSDPFQNVTRNLAVIQTGLVNGFLDRTLAWNIPFGTVFPEVGKKIYDNSLHVPGNGTITNNGYTPYIIVNRWTQQTQNEFCAHEDYACDQRVLDSQTGSWTFEIRSTSTGNITKAFSNYYVWDTIPDPSGNVWILYNTNANMWNMGYADATPWSTAYTYRNDLRIGLLDINTLQISRDQLVSEAAKPVLTNGAWQTRDTSIGSVWPAIRLLTLPLSGNSLPAFFLRNAQGFSGYVYRNNMWQRDGLYDTSGVLTAVPDTTVPSGTINTIPNPLSTTLGTITGTAQDNVGVTNIRLAIRRGASGTCADQDWNGTAWVAACTINLPVTFTSGTTTTWSYSGTPPLSEMTAGQTYHIFLNVTDGAGNVSNWSPKITTVFSGAVPSKPGDLDGDNDVDIFDYNRFVSKFGQTGTFPEDLDGSGKVDIFDYNILVANFGK